MTDDLMVNCLNISVFAKQYLPPNGRYSKCPTCLTKYLSIMTSKYRSFLICLFSSSSSSCFSSFSCLFHLHLFCILSVNFICVFTVYTLLIHSENNTAPLLIQRVERSVERTHTKLGRGVWVCSTCNANFLILYV